MVDLDIVPVASTPTISGIGNGHGAICGSKDRCTFRGCDISTAMVADFSCDRIGTIALRRSNVMRLYANSESNGNRVYVFDISDGIDQYRLIRVD